MLLNIKYNYDAVLVYSQKESTNNNKWIYKLVTKVWC